jgi:hypothetical protein
MVDKKLPRFQNESDEAKWWFEHRSEIGSDLISASRRGERGEGSIARRARKLRELNEKDSAQAKLINVLSAFDSADGSHLLIIKVATASTKQLIRYEIRPSGREPIRAIPQILRFLGQATGIR